MDQRLGAELTTSTLLAAPSSVGHLSQWLKVVPFVPVLTPSVRHLTDRTTPGVRSREPRAQPGIAASRSARLKRLRHALRAALFDTFVFGDHLSAEQQQRCPDFQAEQHDDCG